MSESLNPDLSKAVLSYWTEEFNHLKKNTFAECGQLIYQLDESQQALALNLVSVLGLKYNQDDLKPTIFMLKHLASQDPETYHPDSLTQALDDKQFLTTITSIANHMHQITPDATKNNLTEDKVYNTLKIISKIAIKSPKRQTS